MNLMGEAIWIPKWPIEDSSTTTSSNSNSLATTASPLGMAAEDSDKASSSMNPSQSTDSSGEIFIFETGSFVAWHMSTADAQAFLDEVLKKHATPVEIERYEEPQIEAMGFVVQSGEKTGVKEDMIVIGTTTTESLHEAEGELISDSPTSPPLATAIDPLPSASKGAFSLSAPSSSSQPGTWPGPLSHRSTILPRSEDDLRARLSLSSGLARSTKLAVYEEMLDAHMDEWVDDLLYDHGST